MKLLKFWTPLAPESLFDGTQLDLVPASDCRPRDVRFLLENENESLVAYGDEIKVVEIEVSNENR